MASLADIPLLGGGGHFVMVVGDEGAVLCACRGRDVVERRYAPSPDAADALRDLLASAPRWRVTVMVDGLDISLQRISIPPVAPWEVAGLLRRRMSRAFSDFRCSGALAEGRAPEGRRDRQFLIAGVAPSAGYDGWMAFLERLPNRIAAVALLPVEAAPTVERLAEPLGERASAWQVMVTRERTGGFRQVVLAHGRLAFSRLTRSLDADAPPAEVAQAIDQEFRHTIDYAKRLGLRAGDGIDLIAVLAEDEKEALAGHRLSAGNLLAVTPFEAAARLGLGRSVGRDEGYSDVLHAAALAMRGRPRLTLLSEPMARAERSRVLARRAYLLAAGVGAAGVLYLMVRAGEVLVLRGEVAALERELAAAEARLEATAAEAAGRPRPLARTVAEVEAWRALEQPRLEPAPVIARLRRAIGEDARLVAVDWRLAASATETGRGRVAGGAGGPALPGALALSATLELAGAGRDLSAAVAAGARLAERLREAFVDFRVTVTRPPVPIAADQTLHIDTAGARRGPPDAMTMEVALDARVEAVRR